MKRLPALRMVFAGVARRALLEGCVSNVDSPVTGAAVNEARQSHRDGWSSRLVSSAVPLVPVRLPGVMCLQQRTGRSPSPRVIRGFVWHGFCFSVSYMLNTKYLLTLFLTAALVTTACSNPATSPTSPSSSSSAATAPAGLTAERLAGTWTLSSLLAAGQAEQPVPSGAVYDLTFDNGRVAARTDCNVCNGGFTVSGETTTIGPALACTRAACPTMAFENAYTSILGGDSNVVVLSNTLTLTSSRGRLTFAR